MIYAKNKNPIGRKNIIHIEHLKVLELDNGLFLPLIRSLKHLGKGYYLGGCCDESGALVAGFNRTFISATSNSPAAYGICDSYDIGDKPVKFIEESVIFGGVLLGHFGHFLLECLSRLWYLIENPQDTRKIVFIVHPINKGYKKWFEDFFELLDIPLSRIIFVDKEILKFQHITIPEESIHSWYGYHKKYLIPYQKILSNVPKSSIKKKIYLSRTKLKEGLAFSIGEEWFEEFYRQQGFEIVYPETLPLKEQIALVAGAEHLVCTKGTLCHFMPFLPNNAKVDFLYRSAGKPNHNFSVYVQLKACGISNFNVIDVTYNLFYESRSWGVVLLASTQYFCDYAKNEFGVELEPKFPVEYIEQYIQEQINYLSSNGFSFVANWTSVDWLNQLHRGFYGEELSPDTKAALSAKLPKKLGNDEVINNFKLELSKKQNSAIPLVLDLHIGRVGWVDGLFAHEMTNNATNNQIEALRIHSSEKLNFEYCTEYAGNWGERVKAGEISGTTGKSTAITGFALYLSEKTAKQYEIFYRLADKNGKWSNWTHDGQKVSIGSPVVDMAFKVIRK